MSEVGNSSALVRWNQPEIPNGPIDGYEISVAEFESENFYWTDVGKNESSFEISDVAAGARYIVRLIAYNLDKNMTRLSSKATEVRFAIREYSTSFTSLVAEYDDRILPPLATTFA